MEETTTVVPLDGFRGGGVTDSGGRGVVQIELVFFGGGAVPDGGGRGAVQIELVFFGGGAVPDGGGRGAVQIELVFFGGGGGAVVVWHPPLQLVTTTVEVVRVV